VRGGFPAPFAALLGAVALQRLAELAHSRRNLARTGSGATAANDARHFGAMVAVHSGLIALPAVEVSMRGQGAPVGLFAVALAVYLTAQGVRYWAISSLGRAWNARAVVDPALGVVTGGPYRWIRHPNYLAILLEFLAVPAAGGAWISMVLLNALHLPLLARRIQREEALLGRVPGYAEAMAGKGRFLPHFRSLR
jgi:methyltransferase